MTERFNGGAYAKIASWECLQRRHTKIGDEGNRRKHPLTLALSPKGRGNRKPREIKVDLGLLVSSFRCCKFLQIRLDIRSEGWVRA